MLQAMLYSNSREIEDRVVELLTEGRLTIKSIAARIREDKKISLRGVYKAVNTLIADGVLIKTGKRVMLDQEWAARVTEKLGTPAMQTIETGERAVYTFTSLGHLDAFWKSTVLPLERSISAKEVFFYNPHDFWAYLPARRESEDAYYQHFSQEQSGFLTIGADSRADLDFKRAYQHEYLQINLKNIASIRRTDHVTVLGPYIITIRLSKSLSDRLDALYASGREIAELLPEIEKIVGKPGKIRFVLENNPTKAEKLRKMLSRDFYFGADKGNRTPD